MPKMPSNHECPGPVDRRSWLKIGGLSLGALAVGAQPNLAQILAAADRRREINQDFSVILFWANGGPSHLDTFDLKPHAPTEFRGPFRPIRTAAAGIEITELLPNLAKLGNKFSLIRSLHHDRNQHSGGTSRLLSGYSPVAANPFDAENPEIGSVVAKHLDGQETDIPSFVANTKFYGGGPAYLGTANSPYMPHASNALSSSGNNTYDPIPLYNTDDAGTSLSLTQAAIRGLRQRHTLLKTFDSFRREYDRSGEMLAVDKFNQRAIDILSSPRTRDAFDLSKEREREHDRYSRTHWGRSLLLCRRLVEAGVRFVQCQATFRLKKATGRTSNWDDHSVNSDIFKAFEEKMPVFDMAVPALIQDLVDRGLDQQVLFVFCGEFGRTPKIAHQDKSGRPGRDHWARAMSVFLAGGGLRMGQVIGKTNARAEEPVDRILNSNCLLATIYHQFGIDTSRIFHDNSGRPVPILTDGQPISELL